ncbi:MAG: transcription-repair coupling factor [Oscillospiraceae bacterium]|nr:transcription-repair coupling factor [Oscillospiraceae bacterium]
MFRFIKEKQNIFTQQCPGVEVLLESGRLPVLYSGLSQVHRAHLAASVMADTDRPMFVISPDDTSAEYFARDLSAMLGIEVPVLMGREFTFMAADAVSRQEEQRRLGLLYSLLADEPPKAVVCTASALCQRTLPPEMLHRSAFTLENGGTYSLEDTVARLLLCGFRRTDQVEGPGQFSLRGGILDFFTPGYPNPVRCEFWGDDIDSMGFFDIDSQRRIESIDCCTVLPAAETLPSMYPGGEEALGDRLEQIAKQFKAKRSSANAQEIAETLLRDAATLKMGVTLQDADRYMGLITGSFATAGDYIPYDAVIFLDQPGKIAQRAKDYAKTTGDDVKLQMRSGKMHTGANDFVYPWEQMNERLSEFPIVMADAFTVGRYSMEPRTIASIMAKQLPSYGGSSQTALEDAKRYLDKDFSVVMLAGDERRGNILTEYLRREGINAVFSKEPGAVGRTGLCVVSPGSLSAGMEYPDHKLAVMTDTQIMHRGKRRAVKKSKHQGDAIGSCADLTKGDLVVHEHHGIGRFAGVVNMQVDGADKDYIKICYAGTDVLYVPATQLNLVSKYVGGGSDEDGKPIKLHKMGGAEWNRAKTRTKAAVKSIAKELTALYAARQQAKGFAFSPDSEWQTEFEERFEYPETEDQLRCIAEIKGDMEKSMPMDRLLCGDVGFGKTEVAMRAMMKCVLDGKQAVLLAPTTVLTQQHFQTAIRRFFGYPINIQILNRYRTPNQVKQTLADLASGACDIVIGTHRLLSKDVKFKNLGLLVVDEEQRFGVTHKEHIKEISKSVDVLTLSATPIPRTLNMALSGIRDMSVLEEPPQDRLPIQTYVMEHNWGVVCDAIEKELHRGGQVYYLHNRVSTIDRTASRLMERLEGVSVGVAHGQMSEEMLSRTMDAMAAGEIQVLVCTTIIETGIDIPNVNTIIIEDADRLGLAQLHQIRGRVGRSARRASAYLTYKKDKVLTEDAEKRLNAIREFAEFNSGMRIAMRDLEIRGAGNLLGAEQSGHMIDVGYDMYLRLLDEAVREERGEKPQIKAECSADLAISANIPESYVPSSAQRMDLYRRIALITCEEEADDMVDELIDRFGDPPSCVNALISVALLRSDAGRTGITDISQKAGKLLIKMNDFSMDALTVLLGMPEYRGRIQVVPGNVPCIALKPAPRIHTIDQARKFVRDWQAVNKK